MMKIELEPEDLRPLVERVVHETLAADGPQGDDRLLLTQDEAARVLSISKRTLADLPDVPSVKIGKCRRYPVEGLKSWIRERCAASAAEIAGMDENTG